MTAVVSTFPVALQATPLRCRLGAALGRLQADAELPALARVEIGGTSAEASRWIRAQRSSGVRLYGVVHPGYGLIGAFGFSPREDAATFHYWLGVDYRGKKLGRQLIALLRAQARAAGIRRLYSTVNGNNLASLLLLRRTGFSHIPGLIEAGAAEMLCYHGCTDPARTPPGPSAAAEATLLYTALGVDLEYVVPGSLEEDNG